MHGPPPPEGAAATPAGCTAAANTTLISSHFATPPIEKILAVAKGPVWFLLYPRRELIDNTWPSLIVFRNDAVHRSCTNAGAELGLALDAEVQMVQGAAEATGIGIVAWRH